MKIKKNIYHVIFFDVFFSFIFIFLISIGFFLGFEPTKENLLIYAFCVLGVLMIGVSIFCAYALLCRTYWEFTNNEIVLVKKNIICKRIVLSQILRGEYVTFFHLLLGHPRGGMLVIYYKENKNEQMVEISLSAKKVKTLSSARHIL